MEIFPYLTICFLVVFPFLVTDMVILGILEYFGSKEK